MQQALAVLSSDSVEQAAILAHLGAYTSHCIIDSYSNHSDCLLGCQKHYQQKTRFSLLIIGASIPHDDILSLMAQLDAFTHPKRLIIRPKSAQPQLTALINRVGVDTLLWEDQIDEMPQYLSKFIGCIPSVASQSDNAALERRINDRVLEYGAGFFDYTRLTDQQLAIQVISAFYKFFKDNDDQHQCRIYSKNHILTREGESNPYLWIIANGEVALTQKGTEDDEVELARMHIGNVVGGMSFVTGEIAFTSGITTMKTEVIKLDRAMFSKVLATNSKLLPLFTNLLLRHFNRRLQKSIKTRIKLHETLQSLDAAYKQLIETEKMAQLGQLVAGIAHELNNPVAAIVRGNEIIRQHIPDLLQSPLTPRYRELGYRVLENALNINPTSTIAIRKRAKLITKQFPSAVYARKVVQMDLDDNANWKDYFLHYEGDLNELLDELQKFYQVGNFLRNINACSSRIAGLVKSLKHYSSQDSETPTQICINEGIAETLVIFENRLKHYDLVCDYQPLPEIECYPIALQQVWTNLISNALDATPEGGTIKVTTQELPGQACINVVIEDSGMGIPSDIIDKIFELNYTTKKEGNFGLGIGLTVCKQIVTQHRGVIEVTSEPGKPTQFSITLPIKSNLEETI